MHPRLTDLADIKAAAAAAASERRWWQVWRKRPPTVIGVRLDGIIGAVGFNTGLTLQSCERRIEAAFRFKKTEAVALFINSPGGAPVQAALIHERIRYLAAKHERPVIAFLGDVAASGGYWLALAADEIFANNASIVGSIGVISAGFGFDQAIGRIGVERRHYATGAHKGMLDPFRPENSEDVAILRELHADTYDDFVGLVRTRRDGKLIEPERGDLFDGRVFSGKRALSRGLIDGVGDPFAILRERYGDTMRLRMLEPRQRSLWSRLRGSAGVDHVALVDHLAERIEERLLRMRYGL